MIAEGASDEGDFARYYVYNKDTVHEMMSMFEKSYLSNLNVK